MNRHDYMVGRNKVVKNYIRSNEVDKNLNLVSHFKKQWFKFKKLQNIDETTEIGKQEIYKLYEFFIFEWVKVYGAEVKINGKTKITTPDYSFKF